MVVNVVNWKSGAGSGRVRFHLYSLKHLWLFSSEMDLGDMTDGSLWTFSICTFHIFQLLGDIQRADTGRGLCTTSQDDSQAAP